MPVTSPALLVEVATSQLWDAFARFQSSAFRAELRESYDVPEEEAQFQCFLRGEEPPAQPPAEDHDWLELIARSTGCGKSFTRVRWLPEPITPYVRFEVLWGYRFSVPAGEVVRTVRDYPKFVTIGAASIAVKDFWFFDEELAFVLDYDDRGRFRRLLKVADTALPAFVALKSRLLEGSAALDAARITA